MQKKSLKRVIFISISILLGIGLVYLMAIAGNKSKGPLEALLSKAEQSILNFENTILIKKRVSKRKKKLSWFRENYADKEHLIHPKKILLGASDNSKKESFETIINLEDSLGTTFPIIHIYNAWGSKPEEQFPKLSVKTIVNMGSIPMITWEPWLSDFDEKEYPGIPVIEKRDRECLKAIASGTYDKYIHSWAKAAKEVNAPIFVRFAHEMNDPYRYPWGPQNNKAKDFVEAWKHIHKIFKYQKATNVIWVWSPHPSYKYFEEFFPGDNYVDYIGLGILNFGTAASWSKWWSFEDLLGKKYPDLAKFNKPIMIAEFGSLNVGGDRALWFSNALKDLPKKYPQIKSILFFHYPADKTLTDKKISWYFIEDPEELNAIKNIIKHW